MEKKVLGYKFIETWSEWIFAYDYGNNCYEDIVKGKEFHIEGRYVVYYDEKLQHFMPTIIGDDDNLHIEDLSKEELVYRLFMHYGPYDYNYESPKVKVAEKFRDRVIEAVRKLNENEKAKRKEKIIKQAKQLYRVK